ncbi:CD164 sialomucin-like 2 protein [Scleropages formosus]|uniref:CD164 sialomucin-like 2 protein n=1 Tax=Scleropages formosus TaxID=113540 RepID=UPI0010FA9519|nr:CD164 sialomucin-like 2 protein [Scleropages formosus]
MAFPRAGAAALLLLLGTLETCRCQTPDDCGRLDTCDGCISGDPSLNLTGCVWSQCDDGNVTGCVRDGDDSEGCSVLNDTSTCPASDTSTTSSAGTDSPTEPGPVYSQAKFNLSSFVGGIVLVLSLQAGAFFAMRFIRTKDSSYETIEQTQ